MRNMEPLKFGIIGCSRIAKRSVIPAIMKSEFAELEIIGSTSDGKVKEFAKEFDCKKFGSMKMYFQMIQLMRCTSQHPLEHMQNYPTRQQQQVSMFTLKNLLHTI